MPQPSTIGRQRLPLRLRRLPTYLHYATQLISGIKLRSLLKPGIVIFHNKELKFRIRSAYDLIVLKEVIIENCYFKHLTLTALDNTIIDVGAGFGDFSILAAKQNPKATVYAIEPDESLRLSLRENSRLNNTKNIIPVNKFLTSPKDIFTLHRTKLPTIDFLKVDCEGCEFPFFQNISVSDLRKIKKIALEYHRDPQEILSKLRVAGFKTIIESKSSEDYPGLGLLWAWQDEHHRKASSSR